MLIGQEESKLGDHNNNKNEGWWRQGNISNGREIKQLKEKETEL
jgi:hypothetical protein